MTDGAALAGALHTRSLLSRAVLASLKGTTPEPPETSTPRGALEERAAAGDPEAQRALALWRRLADVPGRVQRALALERVDVVLADGSQLPLDEAERLLANKEDRRVHAALRESVDDAAAPFRQFHRYGSDAATRAAAKAFLVDTAPLRDAARDALAVLGGCPIEGSLSLAWALDLPDAHGAFGEDATRAIIAVLREAVRTPPAAFRAPRDLAGAALEGRYAWPAGLRRADRHVRTLQAAGVASAWSRATSADVGMAAALALAGAAVRRVSGLDRRSAERAARICAATVVLRARAALALAALPEDAPQDEAREAVIHALAVDPGRALLARLAEPSWASVDDETPRAFLRAPLHALALRDAFDETWVVRAEAWDAIEHGALVSSIVEDAPAPSRAVTDTRDASPDVDAARAARAAQAARAARDARDARASTAEVEDVQKKPAPSSWAAAWRTWAGEWL